MSILSKIFSSGATKLVDGIGGVLDSLTTTKEEKLEAELKIKELKNQSKIIILKIEFIVQKNLSYQLYQKIKLVFFQKGL